MQSHAYVAIVSLLALLTFFWMSLHVARARAKCGIQALAVAVLLFGSLGRLIYVLAVTQA